MTKPNKRTPKQEAKSFALTPSLSYGLLAIIVLFFGLIRVRLLNFPLERDEGEYAYAGQLILHGIAPYQLCYSMKLPGTSAAYALFLGIFGNTPAAVHVGLLFVNSATIVLLYFLAARLFSSRLAGVVASASFGLFSIEPSVLGFAAHATQFVVLPATGAILILLKAIESRRLSMFVWSGLLLGLAFLMKQPGIFFALFGLFYLVQSQWQQRSEWRVLAAQAAALILGFAIPFTLTFLFLLRAGALRKFWFWSFSYARQYGTVRDFSDGMRSLWSTGLSIAAAAPLVWLIAAAGVWAVLRDPKARSQSVVTLGLLGFSFAAVCPGLYFRLHYFVLILPAVALLCAVAVDSTTSMLLASRKKASWAVAPILLFVLAFGVSVVGQDEFFFEDDPLTLCQRIYSGNPFAEALQVSEVVRSHSNDGDRIAVIGSEPEIYFYSNRLSATGYVYMYPLMEAQPYAPVMQREVISEIEASHPEFLIFVNSPASWLRKSDSDLTIFSWFEKYVQNGYQLVGIADLIEGSTEYHWSDAATYRPRSENTILVFKRMTAST